VIGIIADVSGFSTIDFHSGTQRLAVGTHEGAVIMYDLKTASRLYVLEAHKSPVSAVTFSPDGRRLVTVSLQGGEVTVWKVGTSLSGLFNVGGPPRQGGERGAPFKRIEFMRADDRESSIRQQPTPCERVFRQVVLMMARTAGVDYRVERRQDRVAGTEAGQGDDTGDGVDFRDVTGSTL
jgi:hypothetical protein